MARHSFWVEMTQIIDLFILEKQISLPKCVLFLVFFKSA